LQGMRGDQAAFLRCLSSAMQSTRRTRESGRAARKEWC
jgi:hypothetical protein